MLLLPRAALAPASVARCQAGRRTLVVRPMAFVAGEAAPEEPSGAAPAPPAAAAKAKRGRPAGAAAAAAKPAATPKPASPLRSPTAFNLFYKARYPAYKEANPGAKLADTSKALRAEWETLPAETKAPFVEQAAGRKAEVDAIKVRAGVARARGWSAAAEGARGIWACVFSKGGDGGGREHQAWHTQQQEHAGARRRRPPHPFGMHACNVSTLAGCLCCIRQEASG